jgi:hypothetical protein
MIWIGHLAHMGQRGMRLGFWWERQKDRDHLEYEDNRWEGDIKMDLRETCWNDVDWINQCRAPVKLQMP